MNICCRYHIEILLDSAVYDLRVEVLTICNLDTVNQTLGVDLLLELGVVGRCTLPARVVVSDECALLLCIADGLGIISRVDDVVVLGEECAVMTDVNRLARDLGTLDKGELRVVLCCLLCQLEREVQVRYDATLIGVNATRATSVDRVEALLLIWSIGLQEFEHIALLTTSLDVVGEGHNVESVNPSLLNTLGRRNLAIRVERVYVQIGSVAVQTINRREYKRSSNGCIAIHLCRGVRACIYAGSQAKYEANGQNQCFFHSFNSLLFIEFNFKNRVLVVYNPHIVYCELWQNVLAAILVLAEVYLQRLEWLQFVDGLATTQFVGE